MSKRSVRGGRAKRRTTGREVRRSAPLQRTSALPAGQSQLICKERGAPHAWACLQVEQERRGEVSEWLPRLRRRPPSAIPRGLSPPATAVRDALSSSSSRMAGTVVLHRLRCEGGKRGGRASQGYLHRPAREATWPTSRPAAAPGDRHRCHSAADAPHRIRCYSSHGGKGVGERAGAHTASYRTTIQVGRRQTAATCTARSRPAL